MKRIVTHKTNYSPYSWRAKALWIFILVLGAVIILRLFWLQVVKTGDYQLLASRQHDIYQDLPPDRGIIYTQNTRLPADADNRLFPLASNQTFYLVYAQPFAVENAEETVKQINTVLSLPQEVLDRIKKQITRPDTSYAPLVHRVTEEKIAQLELLKLPGIKWQKESLRYYPEGIIGSNVVGFVGWVGDVLQGQYGVEGKFDKELKGEAGYSRSERDATGQMIGIGEQDYKKPVNGADIILTIDNSIEAFACQKLDEGVKKYDASGGAVVILNPKTGAIIAMCGNPNFDPNAYNEATDARAYTNPAIFDAYEPGSVFKPITMAAAMDQEKITPDTTYEDTGEVKIANFTIRNSDLKGHGTTSMTDVLKLSLNTGAIFAMRQIGGDVFRSYLEKFGFGQLTGVELNTEMPGTIASLKQKGEIYPATASFGQGIMVTPLQLAAAYTVLANGGQYAKPHIIDEVHDPIRGVYKIQPELHQVVSPRAATLVAGMMVQVVQEGFGKRAGVPGYYFAGKTGTAQIANVNQGGYGDKTMHTFAGFGPVSDPQFVMVVRLDNPTASRFAESTATPIFGDIAKFIVNYYGLKPDNPAGLGK